MDHGAEVAVIGGGYAGCAAAVTLAGREVPVAIYEAAPVLGGRARRVVRDGIAVDNGQHLMLGAYARTLELAARVGGGAYARRPLAIVPFSRLQKDAISLVARNAPGRIGLAVGLLTAQGLTWRERLANLAWFRGLARQRFARPATETVAHLLSSLPPRVATGLWEPLNLAALNTPASDASAQVLCNVLEASFDGRGSDSDFVLPTTDLSAFFPEPAARFVASRAGRVELQARAQVVRSDASSATVRVGERDLAMRAAIVAVGPHQLAQAFVQDAPVGIAPDRYEPIVTIWLGYPSRVAMPGPVARLDDAPGQWAVDRPDVAARAATAGIAQMLAVVISADGPHMAVAHDELARSADAQLRRLAPSLAPLAWSFVIAERRATYACTPSRARPQGPRLGSSLYLAGDYVDPTFPATIEAAVRSGVAAAEAFLADRG